MERKKIDSNLERQFVATLITSKSYLSAIAPVLDTTLLSPFLAIPADWCLQHFKEYDSAPGKAIQARYHAWVENEKPEDSLAEAVHDFLGSLSQEFEEKDMNIPYMLDETAKWLTLKKLERLHDNLDHQIRAGDYKEATELVSGFNTIDLGGPNGFNPLRNMEAWQRTFAEEGECLIEYAGEAGKFFGPACTRDALVGIQAPEKRGKTYVLIDLITRAMMGRRKVAMFQVGDLTEPQIMKRLAMRMEERPLRAYDCMKPIPYPIKIKVRPNDEDGSLEAEVKYEMRNVKEPISLERIKPALKRFCRRHAIPRNEDYFMLSVHPNSTINVKGINGILTRWRHEQNFIPDVIAIDYPDILAPEDARKEGRDITNDTWKALRRLSQEWHALVLAPTQANAASYEAKTQKMKNFSEDKRKLAHVTGMLGLNQTEKEKAQGILRLNWILLRESDFNTEKCLWAAQCLSLGVAFARTTMYRKAQEPELFEDNKDE